MTKSYLKLVRSSLRSLRHPRLVRLGWWRIAIRPIRRRELWIPRRDAVANGVAIGAFFSMIPIPFQMAPSALVAMRARANIPFAMAACWISNPLTLGPLLWAQYRFGGWMRDSLGVPMPNLLLQDVFKISDKGSSFLLGMTTSAILCGLAAYPLVYLFSALMPHLLPVSRRGRTRDASSPSTPDDPSGPC